MVGTLIPLSFFVPFLTRYGMDFGQFMQQIWATDISRFFAADLIIASIVSWCMMAREAQRRNIRYWWVAMAATFASGCRWRCRCFCSCASSRSNLTRPAATATS
ncbi:MAG: DUF2834 domain-containing protein [Anaerolineae bacterium]|nr:DUF2834 domain-containing protein [Anaerolineae bacterium]